MECRFSPDPSKYPDAVRTPLGWLLKEPALVDSHQKIDPDSLFFINVDSFWHAQELNDILINDKDEVWNRSRSMDIDLLDEEKLMSWVSINKEASESGMKYSREDVVTYDFIKRNISYVNGHYELPLPWKNDSAVLPESLPNAQHRLQYLKQRLRRILIFMRSTLNKLRHTFKKVMPRSYPKMTREECAPGICRIIMLSVRESQERNVLY